MTILRHLAADLRRDHAVTVASFDEPCGCPGITETTLARPAPPGRLWRLAPMQRAVALARTVPPRLLRAANIIVALDCHFALALARTRPRRLLYLSLSCIPRQEWFAARPGIQRSLAAAQYGWLERRIAGLSGGMLASSPMHAADLRRYSRIRRPATVLLPAFPADGRACPREPGPLTILAAGRLEPGKDMAAVIVLAGLLRDLPCRWVIAGEGPERGALLAQTEAAGLAGRVHLPGAVADLQPLLAQADIFVHPSRYESFGIAVFEAMRAGLPVLCGPRTGIAPMIGAAGGVVEFGQPEAAALLRAWIGDPTLRARMGAAGTAAAARVLADDYHAGFRQALAALS